MRLNEVFKELEKTDTIMGIDPGMGGGIAIWRNQQIKALNMPRDLKGLNDYFKYIRDISNYPITFIEHVQMYLDDIKETGKQFGIVKLLAQYENVKDALKLNHIPLIPVYPITWQSKLRIRIKGEDKKIRKDRYKEIAQLENPGLRVTKKNCDALLILKFARLMLKNEPQWVAERFPLDYKLF